MTLADALQRAVDRPTTATMGALFDALVAASDEEYLTFWDLFDMLEREAGAISDAREKADRARSLVKRYGSAR